MLKAISTFAVAAMLSLTGCQSTSHHGHRDGCGCKSCGDCCKTAEACAKCCSGGKCSMGCCKG
jgi:hypothetical protein